MNEDSLGAAIEELIFDDVFLIGSGLFMASVSALAFVVIRKLIRR